MSAFGSGTLGRSALGVVALVTLVAGCSSSSSSGKPAPGASSTPHSKSASSGSASALKSVSTPIGTVLVAPSGRTVYELVGDSAAKQTCTGGCLAIWPPVQAHGSQMIIGGHPVFTFVGDRSAGQTKGQNVTDQWGRWLALDASGTPISSHAAARSKAPSRSSAKKSKAPGGAGPAF